MSLTQWARRQALALSQSAVIRGDSQAFRDAIFALTSRNNYADAEFLVEKREETLGTSPFLLWLRASLQAHQDKAEEAINTLNQLIREIPKHAEGTNLLGILYSSQKKWEKAKQCFEKACELDPTMIEAQVNLGWSNTLFSKTSDANRNFRTCFSSWLENLSLPAAPRPKLNLPQVTLCCIDTAYHDLALFAIRRSMDLCDFGKVIFFTDQDLQSEGVDICRIPPLRSRENYSNFVIHQLGQHISTDHLLIIQYDGFVLHPSAWTDEFLQFDYLGPPMMLGEKRDVVGGIGGFSLRSRRLLNALADETFKSYDAHNSPLQEDLFICQEHRQLLETQYGIRFAPFDLAERFASELSCPSEKQFGFHNGMHLMHAIQTGFKFPANPGNKRFTATLAASTAIGLLQAQAEIVLSGWNP